MNPNKWIKENINKNDLKNLRRQEYTWDKIALLLISFGLLIFSALSFALKLLDKKIAIILTIVSFVIIIIVMIYIFIVCKLRRYEKVSLFTTGIRYYKKRSDFIEKYFVKYLKDKQTEIKNISVVQGELNHTKILNIDYGNFTFTYEAMETTGTINGKWTDNNEFHLKNRSLLSNNFNFGRGFEIVKSKDASSAFEKTFNSESIKFNEKITIKFNDELNTYKILSPVNQEKLLNNIDKIIDYPIQYKNNEIVINSKSLTTGLKISKTINIFHYDKIPPLSYQKSIDWLEEIFKSKEGLLIKELNNLIAISIT
ncbi:hypothetical protein [Spiroplasma endosymbiont of Othius punctulatus]|uniref:hypothetical protein n=1 Tax=Spiroplasma endosymbiont of Othius punctulatus TaxID=3066289 RepID=UPI0030CB581A